MVVAAIATGVAGWQTRDDGDTASVTVTAPAASTEVSEAGPAMGGLAELYREQQAATSDGEHNARDGLAELYAEQEAAARSRENLPADPCQVGGARPDFY